MKIPQKKSVLSAAQEKKLPTPPPIAEEGGYVGESATLTKGDIVGYSDTDEDSDDETNDEAFPENSTNEECSDVDDVESEDEIKFLPATVDGLG